jgi:hypothetical protein
MKKITILVVYFFIHMGVWSQSWEPGMATLPTPDSDGYIHTPEGHFAVWKDVGLLKNGMRIRFDNVKVYSQYGDSISISGNYPSVNLKDIIPNNFLNTPIILWATYHMSSQYSSQLDLDKIQRETQTWVPGTLTLPTPDSDGYIHTLEGHFAVWKDVGLLRNGMKIRFDNIKVYSQYGDSISISGNYPSVKLEGILPQEYLNVLTTLWVTYHMSSQYSSQLDLDKIQKGTQTWVPGSLTLPAPDSDGYIHIQEGLFAVWKDAGLLRNGMKIRFDNIKVYSQYGDSISISGNYPSVNLTGILPQEYLNVSTTLWTTYHMSSQYSSQLDLDKIQKGTQTWVPGTLALPVPDSDGYIYAQEGLFAVWKDAGLLRNGMKIRFDNIKVYYWIWIPEGENFLVHYRICQKKYMRQKDMNQIFL